MIKKFLKNQVGQGMVEYGVIIVLIALVGLGGFKSAGGSISTMTAEVAAEIGDGSSSEDEVKLSAGLYNSGTSELVKSWDELVSEGVIVVSGSSITTKNAKSVLVGDLVILDTITSIGDSAFYACTNLTKVTIPDTVTSIGDEAFDTCTGLKSVNIPNGVTRIGMNTFSGCTSLPGIVIPSSITEIGFSAFNACIGLQSVSIPGSVTKIEDAAFGSCTGLKSITISEGVTNIGSSAFENCTGISDITIPNSVTTIGSNAFTSVPHITYSGLASGSPWGALSIN